MEHLLQKSKCSIFLNIFKYMISQRIKKALLWSKVLKKHYFLEPSRQSDWDNIIACHRGINMVTSWSYQRSTMGEHKLVPKRDGVKAALLKHTVAQVCLCLSHLH